MGSARRTTTSKRVSRPATSQTLAETQSGVPLRHALLHTPEGAASLALACLYLALMSGHLYSVDGLILYRQGISLTYTHSLHFHPSILWGGRITTSKYGLGLSLLYVPGLVVWSWLAPYIPQSGTNPYNFDLLDKDPLYTVACAPIEALIAAVSAYLVARLLREFGVGRTVALWGLALYGLASPAMVYAKADWAQPLSGLCWIAALYGSIRFARHGQARDLRLAALAVGYGVVARPLEGTLLLPVAIALIVPQLSPARWNPAARRAVGVLLGAFALGLAVELAANWGRFGSPFNFGYGGESWSAPLRVTLPAVLISPGWGIVWEFPAVILVPLGAFHLHRHGQSRAALGLAVLTVVQLLNTAAWHDWAGGWNWGLRLFLPALPIAAVLAAAGIDSLSARLRVSLPALLFVGGLIWAIPCVLTNLLAGYAGMASTGPIYDLQKYPPIGAWQFVHGSSDIDLLWTRAGGAGGNTALLVGATLLAASLAFAVRVERLTE